MFGLAPAEKISMNSKNTFTWFVVAVALLAFIFIYQFFQRSTVSTPTALLPGLRADAVTGIQVIPNGAAKISVLRTNDNWVLTQPVFYPARRAAVEALLDALQKLQPAVRISPAELRENHDANSEYGFDSPQISLAIQSGDDSRQILVGNKTAPGDQVFVRIVGTEGVFVTDASWLKFIPGSLTDWRDTALVGTQNNYDSITLTNESKIIELHCNPANHLWQMSRPLAARANSDYISKALHQLQTTTVSQFVTDNSNADLTAFGLQPADLDLWAGSGTDTVTAIHFGKAPKDDSSQIYAKRDGWNTVIATPKEPLSPWYGTVNDFRDPYLLELTANAPVAEIEVIGPGTNHYVLQRANANDWRAVGEKFPVDADNVQNFLELLAGLRVSEFVQDVVTPADLPTYGLATPSRQIILRSAVGNTNAVIAQLLFGASTNNEVFVRRTDEDFVYAITPEDLSRLPAEPSWQFRDRSIWNFSETNVTQITLRQSGKIMQIARNGPNQWSVAAGSGFITPAAVEEVVHDLGNMAAVEWVSRGVSDPSRFGLKPDNLSITVTLKNGQSGTVDFGQPLSEQTSLAAVTLDGQRWVFIVSPALYELVKSYLTLTGSVP